MARRVFRAASGVVICRKSLRCIKGKYNVFSIIDSCMRMRGGLQYCSEKAGGPRGPGSHDDCSRSQERESSLTDSELERTIWQRVERINEGLEHYEKIRKVVALKQDFPEKVRSVTAFQKIKIDRKAVADMCQKEIEVIYRADK